MALALKFAEVRRQPMLGGQLARLPIRRVFALIDWNNVQTRVLPHLRPSGRPRLSLILAAAQDEIAVVLKRQDSSQRYRVRLRIYDGWHRERRVSAIRGEFDKYYSILSRDRVIGSVSFAPELVYGNDLACSSARGPLYSTVRSSGQKMIDTSITCDALYLLKEGFADNIVILSDDDDFIPVAFTAEAWGLSAMILRYERRDFSEVSDGGPYPALSYWGDK